MKSQKKNRMKKTNLFYLLVALFLTSAVYGQVTDPDEGDFSLNVHGQGNLSISPPSKISELPEVIL